MSNDLIIYFRLAERAALAIVFISISIALMWAYRKDLSVADVSAEMNGIKVALPLAQPFVAALLLLGYVFFSLSNPVSIDIQERSEAEGTQVSSVLFFDEQGVSRTFTNLAFRDGGLRPENVPASQRLLRASLRIEALRNRGSDPAVSRLLGQTSLSMDEVEARISQLEESR